MSFSGERLQPVIEAPLRAQACGLGALDLLHRIKTAVNSAGRGQHPEVDVLRAMIEQGLEVRIVRDPVPPAQSEIPLPQASADGE